MNRIWTETTWKVKQQIEEEIKKALELKGLTMGRIVQRPIDELVNYHKSLIPPKA